MILTILVMVSACEMNRQTGCVALGAVAGGLLGSYMGSGSGQTLMTVGGAAGGGVLGSELCKD